MNAEKEFFKYAFPCSQTLMQLGRISKEDYEKLRKKFFNGKTPDREFLEKSFVAAFKRIKRLAKEMNKDYWDIDVIVEYWLNNHNKMINSGDGLYSKTPESFNRLCRVNDALVVEKKEDQLIVEYGEKCVRVVSGFLVPNAKVGEKYRIHYGFAIEKI